MAILDNLTKAAKGFFVEEVAAAPAGAATASPQPVPPTPAAPLPAGPAPLGTPPEQRHLDHIASLLAGDGKDFGTYTRMVKSMAGSGLTGQLLYQTAFNAFAALTGTDLPTLLSSAQSLEQKLADDRAKVQARHRDKVGESPNPQGPTGAVALLTLQETRLQTAVADLTKQLAEKSQQLQATQEQLQAERQKAQSALASYEAASAAATAELQAHRQATQSFLTQTSSR
ncbi:hypothetical protein [Hymenobacter terricola]|uniref:hypothetical protein n=1 Tax=Hymenobacter terricola TaxID=2819236 RepID=UPI001B311D36|nr:hypothetical protein [Hymenobacter terricola]